MGDREPDPYVPSDREPLPSGLIPAERLALTVARAQIERGDAPTRNIAAVLVMAVDRLSGGRGECIKVNEPRQYALTRADLIEALARIQVRPVEGKVVAEWMADAILENLDDLADERKD